MTDPNQAMLEMANNMWDRFFKYKVLDMMSSTVKFYRAQVVSAPSDGKITIQEPFDHQHTIPCTASASSLRPGDQCVVLVFGNASNSIVIGDGKLSNI